MVINLKKWNFDHVLKILYYNFFQMSVMEICLYNIYLFQLYDLIVVYIIKEDASKLFL